MLKILLLVEWNKFPFWFPFSKKTLKSNLMAMALEKQFPWKPTIKNFRQVSSTFRNFVGIYPLEKYSHYSDIWCADFVYSFSSNQLKRNNSPRNGQHERKNGFCWNVIVAWVSISVLYEIVETRISEADFLLRLQIRTNARRYGASAPSVAIEWAIGIVSSQ